MNQLGIKLIMWAIIPAAFTLIFFFTVDNDRSGLWISLVFMWIAYLTASAACLPKWGKPLSVLNWSLYHCAVVYFITEIIAAILFLYVYLDYPQWSFTVQLLLLVAFVLVFGFSYISSLKTEEQMQEFHVHDSRVKQWRTMVALMQSDNPSLELKELSDLLSITPIMSTAEVAAIDEDISTLIDSGISDTTQIIKKIKERNIILKSNSI